MACQLAAKIQGEIISADSRQIYRGMDIGTGKDLQEYIVDGIPIPYHLIDLKDPGYKYNIAEFQDDFNESFKEITNRGKMPILCGGSGLYLDTALYGNSYLGIPTNEALWIEMKSISNDELSDRYQSLSETIKSHLNAKTTARKIRAIEIAEFLSKNPDWKGNQTPDLNPLIIGVDIDRDLRRKKISKRLIERVNSGLIEEVEQLVEKGLSYADLDYYGLEYKWVGQYLQKKITKKEMIDQLEIAIHQFAKRQMTWFRRMEKQGTEIHWINATTPTSVKIETIINRMR